MCGAEIDKDAAVCPACDAPLDALIEEETEEIDNSEAIEAMLKSASKLMQDSAEAFSFDDDENAEATETEKQVELSDEQKKILDRGGVVDLSAMETAPAEVSLSDSADVVTEDIISAETENTPPEPEEIPEPISESVVEPIEEPVAEPVADEEPPAEIEQQPEIPEKKKKVKEPKPKKEKLPKEKKASAPVRMKLPKKPKPVKSFEAKPPKGNIFFAVLIIVAFAVGIAGGFFIRMLTTGEIDSRELSFAKTAASSIASTFETDESLIAYEAYVRFGAEEQECLLYGGKRTGIGEYENQWFRVVIDNEQADTVKVYFQLDYDVYDEMKSSGDEQQIVAAGVMMSYEETLQNSIASLSSGTIQWSSVSCDEINSELSANSTLQAEDDDSSETQEGEIENVENDVPDLVD